MENIGFIALGSNVDVQLDRSARFLEEAIAEIRSVYPVQAVSPIYKTPCFPAGAGPDFANAVIAVTLEGESQTALQTLHGIEASFGRKRDIRWGQRSLDLDLLAHGSRVAPSTAEVLAWVNLPLADQLQQAPAELILPHPRLQDRAFVLGPWQDIAPDWVHPILGRSVAQMWQDLPQAMRDEITPLTR